MVIEGMRNSWESWGQIDSRYSVHSEYFEMGANDKALCLRLIKAGSDHAKFMRQLPIVLEVKAPEYFWKEFDTYRIGVQADDVTQNSTSMMHVLGKLPFLMDMFSFEDMDKAQKETILETLNCLRDRWIDEGGKRKGPEAHCWRAMLQAIPQSWNYTRTISTNYQALRAMYHARKNHRLSEWRTFCTHLESLPYNELITA